MINKCFDFFQFSHFKQPPLKSFDELHSFLFRRSVDTQGLGCLLRSPEEKGILHSTASQKNGPSDLPSISWAP